MWNKRAEMVVHQEDPFNAEPPRDALGLADLTPLDTFYVRGHGPVPEIDPSTWRLRVDGLVSGELELSLDQLREGFSHHEVTATLQCAGNRRVGFLEVRDIPGEAPWGPGATGNAIWKGVRLRDLLAQAGIGDEAGHVEFLGEDICEEAEPTQAFGASIPLHKAVGDEVLLAWEMNGQPLSPVHGAPVRVVVPGYIGARSVKWLRRIRVLAEPSGNFFQASTYRLLTPQTDPAQTVAGQGMALGSVAVNADILVPDEGAHLPSGRTRVAGYAFAGDDRSIERVDVSTDAGTNWIQATLGVSGGPWAWRRWELVLDLTPATTQIVARAWDSSAATQPESPAQLWNPKGYVNNAWARIDVHVTDRGERAAGQHGLAG